MKMAIIMIILIVINNNYKNSNNHLYKMPTMASIF